MQVPRTLPQFVWVLFLSLVTFNAFGTNVCTGITPANSSIEITATTGEGSYPLTNPILALPPKKDTPITAGWFADLDTTKPITEGTKPFPLTLGYCGPGKDDPTKPVIQYLTPASDFSALSSAETIVIRFVPNEPGKVMSYLKLNWTADKDSKPQTKTYIVTATAGVPDYANDSRYKLWAYAGYTYLRSQNDFKDGFAELLVRAETRWIDERVALKQYHPDLYAAAVRTGHRCDVMGTKTFTKPEECPSARFSIVRIYGESGLTGTTVVTTNGTLPGTETKIGGVTQAFGGNVGLGIGHTRLVSVLKDTDTSAFSMLLVARLGMISIPGEKDATTGKPIADSRGAFNDSINIRIENEPTIREDNTKGGGNFEGAYFELGFGESEQFSRKKYPRIRFDGLLPINSGSDLFRFATRLQIDAPRPFSNRKIDKAADNTTGRDNLANEIRISVLFNIDLLQLGKRMAGK